MAKKVQDIVYEDGAPATKYSGYGNGRGVCGWGGYDESGLEREGEFEELFSDLKQNTKKEDIDVFDVVCAYNPETQEWVDGVVIDFNMEFGQKVYCIEPLESDQSFTTTKVTNHEPCNLSDRMKGDFGYEETSPFAGEDDY